MSRPVAYIYAKCSTCRKALAWLEEHGQGVETIDIVSSPPSAEALARIAELAGVPHQKLFNVSGASYREGQYATRLRTMSPEQAFAALARDGKLIKRPLLVGTNFAIVGFDVSVYERRFSA